MFTSSHFWIWFFKLNLGCFGTFCLPCQSGDNGEALSESYWLCFLTACFAPYISTFLTRRKLRKQYGIQGSDFEDVLASVCCGCCANIQIANELDARKAWKKKSPNWLRIVVYVFFQNYLFKYIVHLVWQNDSCMSHDWSR